jgi:3-deoxy-D-manno-octulosonic-acid transferase
MEALKKNGPQIRIVLTFFSPSGFDVRKSYPMADFVFYLPADLPGAAERFYNQIKPDMGIIVKYEFWQGFLHEAYKRNIPLFLISGIFRKNMLFFKPYGAFFRRGLKAFRVLFVQDADSERLLKKSGFEGKITVCGDTRLDRVLEAVKHKEPIQAINTFKGNLPLWVCGSTWPADDNLILEVIKRNSVTWKTLLVPHEIHEQYIDSLCESPKIVRLSAADEPEIANADVLILDRVGMLMNAYGHADWAYVGGGFGKAVHNTMEPAAHGIPVLFGPNHTKFKETGELITSGGGFCVKNLTELEKQVLFLAGQETERIAAGNKAAQYVNLHAGATSVIVKELTSFLWADV